MTIEEVIAIDEKQIFDRKSINIKPADLSDTICAFANADGGTVADASIDDLDLDFVGKYCKRIGYSKSPEEYLRENKKFITIKEGKEQVSVAAILLFGKNPQTFFPRAFIRFIRYDGIEAKVGKDMNVVKDVIFEGRILDQVEKAVEFIKIQMKEKTYLGHDGIFVTEEEYRSLFVLRLLLMRLLTVIMALKEQIYR